MMAKSKASSKSWILACWRAHQQRILGGFCAVEWSDSMQEWQRCWCCGAEDGKRLQRCHIVAKSIGGSDEPSNIVPLCRHCHDLMPDTPDVEYFWTWMKKQQNPLSGIGLGRFWPLYEPMSAALQNIDASKVDEKELVQQIKDRLNLTVIHFAQSNKGPDLKMSTIEWAVLSVFADLPRITP